MKSWPLRNALSALIAPALPVALLGGLLCAALAARLAPLAWQALADASLAAFGLALALLVRARLARAETEYWTHLPIAGAVQLQVAACAGALVLAAFASTCFGPHAARGAALAFAWIEPAGFGLFAFVATAWLAERSATLACALPGLALAGLLSAAALLGGLAPLALLGGLAFALAAALGLVWRRERRARGSDGLRFESAS